MQIPKDRNTHEPKLRMASSSFGISVLACWSIFLLTGCGPDRPTTIPVHGTITVDGQPPPAEGAIYFAPITVAEGYDRRPGRARFDTSGEFSASSFVDGDGLVPGTYRVRLESWKVPPVMGGPPGVSYFSSDFTPPDIEVSVAKGSVTYDLDIPQSTVDGK